MSVQPVAATVDRILQLILNSDNFMLYIQLIFNNQGEKETLFFVCFISAISQRFFCHAFSHKIKLSEVPETFRCDINWILLLKNEHILKSFFFFFRFSSPCNLGNWSCQRWSYQSSCDCVNAGHWQNQSCTCIALHFIAMSWCYGWNSIA